MTRSANSKKTSCPVRCLKILSVSIRPVQGAPKVIRSMSVDTPWLILLDCPDKGRSGFFATKKTQNPGKDGGGFLKAAYAFFAMNVYGIFSYIWLKFMVNDGKWLNEWMCLSLMVGSCEQNSTHKNKIKQIISNIVPFNRWDASRYQFLWSLLFH